MYIIVYEGDTKASDGGAGETGRYAVAVRPEAGGPPWYWGPDASGPADDPPTPDKYYTVSLSCDIPDEVVMTGCGAYTGGSTAVIGYDQK